MIYFSRSLEKLKHCSEKFNSLVLVFINSGLLRNKAVTSYVHSKAKMGEAKSKILCIDDDEDTCLLVKFALEEQGFEVKTCDTAEEGLLHAHKENFDAIILDNWFEETSGVEICEEIRSFDTETPIIFFSGEARQEEIDKAISGGATAYLVKPIGFEKLTETVIRLIEEKAE